MLRSLPCFLLLATFLLAQCQLPDIGPESAALVEMRAPVADLPTLSGNPALLIQRANAIGVSMANRFGIREWTGVQLGYVGMGEHRALGLSASTWGLRGWRQWSLRIRAALELGTSLNFGVGAGYRNLCVLDQCQPEMETQIGARIRHVQHGEQYLLVTLRFDSHLNLRPYSQFLYSALIRLHPSVSWITELGLDKADLTARTGFVFAHSPWTFRCATAFHEPSLALGVAWANKKLEVLTALQWHPVLDASPYLGVNHAL